MTRPLSILIPHDIGDGIVSNPFLSELVVSLERLGHNVCTGLFRFSYPLETYDIVNIHWPEYLVPATIKQKDAIDWLADILRQIPLDTKVVATVHNCKPHQSGDTTLYELVYSRADGFAHFANASIKYLQKEYAEQTAAKSHCILMHGNYSYFGNSLDRIEAKQKLCIPPSRYHMVIVGNIRKSCDYDVFKEAVFSATSQGVIVSFCGSLTPKTPIKSLVDFLRRAKQEYLSFIRRLPLLFCKGFIHRASWLRRNDFQVLLSSSDFVFIHRPDSLNSGNIALGFTYGCTVIGPSTGNIGEVLKDTKNYVYEYSYNSNDVRRVLISALKHTPVSQLNAINLQYSAQSCWPKVALQYSSFFGKLMSS